MTGNPIRWFEIYVQDMARARKFYETVFEAKLNQLGTPDSKMEMWTFPMGQESYGSTGALVKMEGCTSGGSSIIIYFASDDCAVEAARVAKAGGKIHKEKFSIGEYGFIALAYDSEGNMIGIHSMK